LSISTSVLYSKWLEELFASRDFEHGLGTHFVPFEHPVGQAALSESRPYAGRVCDLSENGTLVGKSRYRRDEAARREQGVKQRSGLTYKKLRKLQLHIKRTVRF